MQQLYNELHRTARHYMQLERPGHPLQTAALVNEAYLRLAGGRHVEYKDRLHLFALAAQVMRRVLVDHARSRGYKKGAAGADAIALEDSRATMPAKPRSSNCGSSPASASTKRPPSSPCRRRPSSATGAFRKRGSCAT